MRVLEDARASHGGLRDHNGDVRVAGDDFPAWVVGAVVGSGGFGGGAEFDGVAGGDASAETLGDDVHVGQPACFDDFKVEVAVEVHEAIAVGF